MVITLILDTRLRIHEVCEDAYNESDCENEGDYVCDTPPHTQNMNVTWNECYDIDSYEHEILSTNAMSYSSSQTGFTNGQIDRMQSYIQNTNLIEVTNHPCACFDECQGDMDEDGAVAIQDLLELLTNFGTSGDCLPSDLDANGVTGSSDVLILMSVMGTLCY